MYDTEAMVLTYGTRPRVLIPMARLCDLGGNGLKNVRSKLRLELISGGVLWKAGHSSLFDPVKILYMGSDP